MAYIQDKAKRWLAEAGADKLGGMIREGKQANLALVAAIAACDVADGVIGGLSDVYQPKGTKTVSIETLHEMAKRVCIDNRSCVDCPMRGIAIPYSGTVSRCAVRYIKADGERIEKAIEALRKWAAENPPAPVKTYREDFFEKFPDAPRCGDGYPFPKIADIYPVNASKLDAARWALTPSDAWDKPLGYWEKP